jgi:hypothetical protein
VEIGGCCCCCGGGGGTDAGDSIVLRRLSGDKDGCCETGPESTNVVVDDKGYSLETGVKSSVFSGRLRFCADGVPAKTVVEAGEGTVSSGGVRALELRMPAAVRGGIAVEVGRWGTVTEPEEEPLGVWLSEGRDCSGLLMSDWDTEAASLLLLRVNVPVPGISESSPGWPSVRRRGFMIRLGAPPEPITSG